MIVKTYLTAYIGATILALLFTPIVILLARIFNIYDKLDVRKVHDSAMPRIGGAAIVFAVLGTAAPIFLLDNAFKGALKDPSSFYVLAVCSFFVFAVGLIDDISHLRARTKFFSQLAAAFTICYFGIRIDSIPLWGAYSINLGLFAWPLTMLWIVGVTNAINLIDGLDGLAAGIATIVSGSIAVYSIHCGMFPLAVMILILAGALTGFLCFNFNPARIFMGDCGSTYLGFVLAAAAVLCVKQNESGAFVGLALPILALGIPIFDTLFSILRRSLERRSIFSPDRSHFHHRLLDLGMDHKHVVLFNYILTVSMAGFGMFILVSESFIGSFLIFFSLLILLVLIFQLVGAVRLRESYARFRHKQALITLANHRKRCFEKAQLLLRRPMNFEQWWLAVQQAAEQLGIAWLMLPQRNRDGSCNILAWKYPGLEPDPSNLLETNLPVRQRRIDDSLRISLAVTIGGSLESAGHCIALFSRLIDEHSVQDLPELSDPDHTEKRDHIVGIINSAAPAASRPHTAALH